MNATRSKSFWFLLVTHYYYWAYEEHNAAVLDKMNKTEEKTDKAAQELRL